ncbi:MAG TPA: hypothetical protein VEL70_00530 [Candidatus Acidoferrum sp.]|nr:hypothetical protein [Candidatus Acidoferrum sp.]
MFTRVGVLRYDKTWKEAWTAYIQVLNPDMARELHKKLLGYLQRTRIIVKGSEQQRSG